MLWIPVEKYYKFRKYEKIQDIYLFRNFRGLEIIVSYYKKLDKNLFIIKVKYGFSHGTYVIWDIKIKVFLEKISEIVEYMNLNETYIYEIPKNVKFPIFIGDSEKVFYINGENKNFFMRLYLHYNEFPYFSLMIGTYFEDAYIVKIDTKYVVDSIENFIKTLNWEALNV